MARYVRIDDGPGIGTFLLVAGVLFVAVGPFALGALVLMLLWKLWRRLREGTVTPADLFRWIVGPFALAALMACFR